MACQQLCQVRVVLEAVFRGAVRVATSCPSCVSYTGALRRCRRMMLAPPTASPAQGGEQGDPLRPALCVALSEQLDPFRCLGR